VFWLVLFLAAVGQGCATTEEDELSDRPWNTPRGWEHGLPPGMYEQR